MRKTLGRPEPDDGSVAVNDTSHRRPRDSRHSDLQVHIGDKLKALYAEVVNQPVPDHLLDLVTKLEARSKGA